MQHLFSGLVSNLKKKRQMSLRLNLFCSALETDLPRNDSTTAKCLSGTKVVRRLLFTPSDVTLMGQWVELAPVRLFSHCTKYLVSYFPSSTVGGAALRNCGETLLPCWAVPHAHFFKLRCWSLYPTFGSLEVGPALRIYVLNYIANRKSLIRIRIYSFAPP